MMWFEIASFSSFLTPSLEVALGLAHSSFGDSSDETNQSDQA